MKDVSFPRFSRVLQVLMVLTLGLMALGAGVRTMKAGLSCPDWPLCFGQVIPDFHPGVYFEFIHRAYAGVVALLFFGVCVYVLRQAQMPRGAKRAAVVGLFFLLLQILMGGLTVLLLVRAVIVTSHLMLATLFFCSLLWMYWSVRPPTKIIEKVTAAPRALRWISALFVWAILAQILLGGLVASTYAGSVCVDWPLCNGQWVPTWRGAIGLQIIHRMVAYALVLAIAAWAVVMHTQRRAAWMTPQLLSLSRMNLVVVLAQVGVGIANLLYYIPPSITVLHQTMAMILLAVNIRMYLITRKLSVLAPSEVRASKPQAVVTGPQTV